DSQHILSRWRRTFTMDDHLATIRQLLLPGEVVMVLDHEQRLLAKAFRHSLVDLMMVGRCVVACQVHRDPVFLSGLGVKVQPREILSLCGKQRLFLCHARIMSCDLRTESTGSGMRKHGQVISRWKLPIVPFSKREYSELHEVISTT